eukprot:Lithocolla_globosa_v1_NODE_5208_length_1283_cov_18.264658.p2 type:complete len:113 gc:universal NODE_5208_length_1283_cov_18.264658:85-423(+)
MKQVNFLLLETKEAGLFFLNVKKVKKGVSTNSGQSSRVTSLNLIISSLWKSKKKLIRLNGASVLIPPISYCLPMTRRLNNGKFMKNNSSSFLNVTWTNPNQLQVISNFGSLN